MPTYTFYPDSTDGRIYSTSTTYSSARSGAGLAVDDPTSTSTAAPGQLLSGADYYCLQTFLSFDTSSIPDGETVTGVTLSLYGNTDSSTTDFLIEAREHAWGATLDTTDFVAGASLSSKTLLASYDTASGFSTAAYTDLTSDAAFLAAINKTGSTRLLLASSRQRTNNAPTGNEYVNIWLSEQGSTKRPKLVVTTSTNTTPSLAITSPADGTSFIEDTPSFVCTVTDPDSGQTITLTVEISTTNFGSALQTLSTTQSTPASAVSKTVTATALPRGVTYYWRANVSDGSATSSWTTVRSFTVYRAGQLWPRGDW